jgi:cytochrome c oxidase cbb3-type subunit 3
LASRGRTAAALACTLVIALAAAGCDREERRFRDATLPRPPSDVPAGALRPGGAPPTGASAGGSATAWNPYENNAWAMSEGKQLYAWFNCAGCHAQGGGGIGPALMDDVWIYGSEPPQIFATIVGGRPNGMPSFAGRLSDQQVWQLVTYVRALSGQARLDVASSRSDHMMVKPSEVSMPEEQPKDVPPAH